MIGTTEHGDRETPTIPLLLGCHSSRLFNFVQQHYSTHMTSLFEILSSGVTKPPAMI